MSIAALPSQTVNAFGSAQVLTDSASVVKELVDNALDAHSTSITIEIATNALDIIQCKDNGHGIAPADHALVCKRYCTSKIKDLDDLAKIGGASLGFRGEALASAVQMSGGIVVSTRIAGEATGVSLKVSHSREVEKYSTLEPMWVHPADHHRQRKSSIPSGGNYCSDHGLPAKPSSTATDGFERFHEAIG